MASVAARSLESQSPPAPAAHDVVDSLLARMTLEEKIGQMTQVTIQAVAAAKQTPGRIALDPAKLREAVVDRHVGSLINVLDGALTLEGWQALLTQIQNVATTETRLHIPVLYGIDFVHGANYIAGGTVFPHNIAMAATFDSALAERAGEVTALEASAAGVPWNFAPVLDVGRQPLWPRFYETFGEDPLVGATLGAASVVGMQRSGRVAATMKHYLAYGMPRTGRDRTPADVSEREVREYALPAFRAAVRAGARAVMVNSGEIDGEPLHASRHWLTDVLRGELGFDGVIVTDWQDIGFLHTRHRVAPTMKDAVRLAIDAGVDMSMTPYDFEFADLLDTLVKEGTIPEHRIDESVRRILRLKAAVGLLDERPTYGQQQLVVDLGAHASRHLALDAAREAVTLLKNDHVLPLRADARVLVTGPAARSATALDGGWSYTWQGADVSHYPAGSSTFLDAVRKRVPRAAYVPGAGFTHGTDADVATAQRAARAADVAIVVLGEDAYAEWIGDLADLTLPEPQLRLARAVAATGTPTILVLLEGRPRIIAAVADAAKGIVLGYWPGMEGAEALAEVLFGETNPSGRLPFTYPRAPNALLTYDHRYTETLNTGFTREAGGFDPQFDFGHGLSYTTFAYRDLVVDRETVSPDGTIGVRVTVANTGSRSGAETVLLFSRQQYASLTPSVRRLRAFQRVELAAGESRTVHFSLPASELSYVGRNGRPVLEPGAFDLMVGGLTVTLKIALR